MRLKDPTEWMDDLTVFLDDESVRELADEIESTLVYSGSKPVAAVWIGLVGLLAGILGGVTLSPELRQSAWVFTIYLAGALVLFRVLHPLTKRLMGSAIAWAAALSMFWAFLLGVAAVMGARLDSVLWGYVASGGAGAFLGLMCGSLNPNVIRREDPYLLVALALGPVGCVAGTYVARSPSLATDIPAAAAAGAVAAGPFTFATAALLAWLWDEAYGLSRMGLLYLHNENFAPKAVAYLDRAIALAPGEAELYNLRGVAFSKMDDTERAAADWQIASELAPNDPALALNRGVDWLRRGDLEQAIAALDAALAIDPDDAKAHSNLGVAYERLGNLDRAIDHFSRAIAQAPDHANAYSNRGYAYYRKGQHERALEDCGTALELEPALAMAAVNRGHVLAALGRIDEATESYQSAVEMEPEPAVREEALRGLDALRHVTPADASA
jgi:tetratricopeptide (TPR) repeat protein